VYFDGTDYWLADGFHRVLAAKRIGRKNIEADVKGGTREDAAWTSCGSNRGHGLRRTHGDKRTAVLLAVQVRPQLSDELIGRHVGVAREYVFRVRKSVRANSTVKSHAEQPVIKSQVEQRVGVDGKLHPMPAPVPQSNGARGLGPPPRPDEDRRVFPAPMRPPEPPAPYPVDDMGRRLPEHVVPLWERGREAQEMLTALSRIRVTLRKAQESRDPLFAEVPFSGCLAHLDQVYDCVQVAKPYAVCAYCQGHGCKACAQRGLVSKFRYKTVPRELQEAAEQIIKEEQANAHAAVPT
jgi:hypothetical protein